MATHFRQKILALPFLLITIALACAMPGIIQEAPPPPTDVENLDAPVQETPFDPTLPPPPTPTLRPLPPTVVEVKPIPGTTLPLQPNFTFYFNQPMDKPSVELALTGQPALSGRFTWIDDLTMSFALDEPLLAGTTLSLQISTSALAENGQFLQDPITLDYKIAPPLKLTQLMPEPGAAEVNPTSAIVASFNQPVVPADTDADSLPGAFTIDPSIPGTGEWINSGTFIFYPDSAMVGGTQYIVRLNPQLTSIYNEPFEGREIFELSPFEWTFETALPRIVSISPGDGAVSVALDTEFMVDFSQSMDIDSVEDNFIITDPGNDAIDGTFKWNEYNTSLIFTPTNLLSRDTNYNLVLLDTARTSGGTSMGFDTVSRFRTVPDFKIVKTSPVNKGETQSQSNVSIHFNGPAEQIDNPFEFVGINPKVENLQHWWGDFNQTLNIQGDFKPLSVYTVTISDSFPDLYGAHISEPYTFTFKTEALNPALELGNGSPTFTLRPDDPKINAQITNLNQIDFRIGSIPFQDMVEILTPENPTLYQDYQPEISLDWSDEISIPGDNTYTVQLPITPQGQVLDTGIYHLAISASELKDPPPSHLLISTNIHLSLKLSTTSAFVWAVDLRSMQPVSGEAVAIYDSNGVLLTNGSTDTQGIFQSPISTQSDLHSIYYAVMAEPGDDFFSLCQSDWSQGIDGRDFGFSTDFTAPSTTTFLYTDKQEYKPGQTVYFRGIVRHEHNGRYAFPGVETIPITIFDSDNNPIQQLDLNINEFGTIYGDYLLAEDAEPGTYRLEAMQDSYPFDVAESRQSDINLTISSPDNLIAGEEIVFEVRTNYAFNAPADNIPISWKIHRIPVRLELIGFQVGADPFSWLDVSRRDENTQLGELVASGETRTNMEGLLIIRIPIENQPGETYRYTLEATLTEGSDNPITDKANTIVQPTDIYIGLRPDKWVGQAGDELGFDILSINWDHDRVIGVPLTARFREVSWTQSESPDLYTAPIYTPTFRTVSSADLITGEDGLARLSFTPPKAGTFQLEVNGDQVRSSILVWVDGTEPVTWPNPPNNQIKLIADKQTYLAGDIATIFIPNPFESETRALITIERDEILRYDVIHLNKGGASYSLPLSDQDTPNIYLSVILVGKDINGKGDFRQGYINIEIQAIEKELNIHFKPQDVNSAEIATLEPGDKTNFSVKITDFQGRPVRSEFSIQLKALNSLSVKEPKISDNVTALYREQPLGVRTGSSFAVDSQRQSIYITEEAGLDLRIQENQYDEESFDTIFWQADILTDDNGETVLTLEIPDNASTYQLEVQAISADSLAGTYQHEWNWGEGLLLRPITPGFLIAGDHTKLNAEITNQTGNELLVDVSLQANGFILDPIEEGTQRISISPNRTSLVTWTGSVEETTDLDLLFSASADGFQTFTRLDAKDLPVYTFSDPYAFSKAGVLDTEGERLQVINLPRTYFPTSAELEITLAPSLAAAMEAGFDYLEAYPIRSSDQILSSFLPNLIAYRTIQDLGLDAPTLAARVDRTVARGIHQLILDQNAEGGWEWWPHAETLDAEVIPSANSDPLISAYILLGLNKAIQAGVNLDQTVIERGQNYLLATLPSLELLSSTWQLDQLAFHYFALSLSGEDITNIAKDFFDVRDQLSPYAEAFLALTLANLDHGDARIETILKDLEISAMESEAGKYWEGKSVPANLDTPIMNTAVVLYVFAKFDPASHLIADTLNYLMTHRKSDGSWGSSYETAWTLLALTEVMKGTGELAGDFSFSADLNGDRVIEGQGGGNTRLNAVSTTIPMEKLNTKINNGLFIQRSAGPGRLYYLANLDVNLPAADVEAISHGIHVARSFQINNVNTQASVGDLVTVRILLILEKDVHYLILEDAIPAGSQILDFRSKSLYLDKIKCGGNGTNCYLPQAPYANGWGWWWFNAPLMDENQITWTADYLPADTYELIYTLLLTHPGEYQVLPTRAWQSYLPEVYGSSAGELFTIGE